MAVYDTLRTYACPRAETPATTLDGINAKLQVSMKAGRNTAIARSAADDLERLVREG